ncbi:MAG: hypothetical protein ABI873_01795 [Marmoricola sp.]
MTPPRRRLRPALARATATLGRYDAKTLLTLVSCAVGVVLVVAAIVLL